MMFIFIISKKSEMQLIETQAVNLLIWFILNKNFSESTRKTMAKEKNEYMSEPKPSNPFQFSMRECVKSTV